MAIIYTQSLLQILFSVYSSHLVQRFGYSKPLSRKVFFQCHIAPTLLMPTILIQNGGHQQCGGNVTHQQCGGNVTLKEKPP